VLGNANVDDPAPVNAGLGIVSPLATAHAAQSWPSDRVIVADDGDRVTWNAELSGVAVTCGGNNLFTEMLVLLAGTLHTVS
jgi:hypothetical protein